MADRIVINASPLIAFGQMQFFHIAAQMPFEFICPAEVVDEIAAFSVDDAPRSEAFVENRDDCRRQKAEAA